MRLYENFDQLLATEGFYIDQNYGYGSNAIFINRRIIDTGTINEILIGKKAYPDSLEDFPMPKVLYAEYKRNGLGYWLRGWGPVSETEEYVIIETHNVVVKMSTFGRGKGTSEPYNRILSYIINLCE